MSMTIDEFKELVRRAHSAQVEIDKALKAAQPSITCPVCGMTSFNPTDIEQGYCGLCNDWTRDKNNERKED